MLLTLTGCPLKDDYFIDAPRGGSGGGGGPATSGGRAGLASGGVSPTTGGAGTAGTLLASGGVNTGGAAAGTGGSGACDAVGCTNACCGDACVDLLTDAAHCGACGVVCPAGRGCAAGACAGGWVPVAKAPAAFVARQRAGFTTFDGKVFIFGGTDASGNALNSAAIYEPGTDSWTPVSVDAATPTPRELPATAWTGTHVLVYGGRSGNGMTYYQTGALYDPATDSWSAISTGGTPRAASTAVGFGNQVLIWGGLTTGALGVQATQRYDSAADSWRTVVTTNGPPTLLGAGWAFDTTSFYVYGGLENSQRRDGTFRYQRAADAWETLARAPAARSSPFVAADGAALYAWGGKDGTSVVSDGAVLTTKWTSLPSANAPTARCAPPRQSGWSFALGAGDIVFLGGQDGDGTLLTNGGRYAAGAWTRIPSWPSGEDHSFGVAALVGKEIVLWGGQDGNDPTATGERWAP